MNTSIQKLVDSIKGLRLASKTDTEEFTNINSLLNSLKALALAKHVTAEDKYVAVEELSEVEFLEVVKSKFKSTRKAVIMILSKSDDDEIGSKTAYIKKVDDKEIPVTYDELTLVEMETHFTLNPYLQTLINELYFLNGLLPKQLDEIEIRKIISENNLKSVREVMPYFRQFYPGKVDNRLLSTIAKSI